MINEILKDYRDRFDSNISESVFDYPLHTELYIRKKLIENKKVSYDPVAHKHFIIMDEEQVECMRRIIVDKVIWDSVKDEDWVILHRFINAIQADLDNNRVQVVYLDTIKSFVYIVNDVVVPLENSCS